MRWWHWLDAGISCLHISEFSPSGIGSMSPLILHIAPWDVRGFGALMLMDMGSRMAGHCREIITSFTELVDRSAEMNCL